MPQKLSTTEALRTQRTTFLARSLHRESFSPAVFCGGEGAARRMRGRRLGDRPSENAPHPHFVSPSPRKKTRGEGLSTGKMLSLRLCRAPVSVVTFLHAR